MACPPAIYALAARRAVRLANQRPCVSVVSHILGAFDWDWLVVTCSSCHGADAVIQHLAGENRRCVSCGLLRGDRLQDERKEWTCISCLYVHIRRDRPAISLSLSRLGLLCPCSPPPTDRHPEPIFCWKTAHGFRSEGAIGNAPAAAFPPITQPSLGELLCW